MAKIFCRFNNLNKRKRDLKELVVQWRNTKGKVKTRDSQYKRAKLMTGGGPPPPSPPAEDLAIMQAMPNEFIVDSNRFDSDSLQTKSFTQSPVNKPKTNLDDPWTPIASTSKQIKEIKDITDQPESFKALTAPVQDTIVIKDSCQSQLRKSLNTKLSTIDPWTPMNTRNQIEGTEEVIMIPDQSNLCTPVAAPIMKNRNIRKRFTSQRIKKDRNYEEELFLVAKGFKERENERAEELHRKRMSILDLEYEYWKNKLNNMD